MLHFFQYINPFRKPSPKHMRDVLIEEAERLAIEHTSEAEKAAADARTHRVMADMFKARAVRLRNENLIGG